MSQTLIVVLSIRHQREEPLVFGIYQPTLAFLFAPMTLTVDTDAHDGGLRQCLSKCHELIIKHCIGKLGMTTLSDFVDFATKADYAEE